MKIISNFKTLGVIGMFMLAPGMFSSCQKIREPKPNYDIIITEHSSWLANGKYTIHAKIEDGSSYETETEKFIMSNGKLIRFDKKTKIAQEVDTMHLTRNEFEDFEEVARYCNEYGDTLCLSAGDIETAKKWNPIWGKNDNLNGKGIIKSSRAIEFWPSIFKYDDTSDRPHKWY